jgi:methylamine dehydrogenase accessory protein MauD
MSGVWLASYIVLWVLMAFVVLTVLALARQIGLLSRRIPAVGAREEGGGPLVGDPAPPFDEVDLLGNRVTLSPDGGRTVLVFTSSGCRACDEIAPAIRSIAKTDRDSIRVFVVSQDAPSVAVEWANRHRLSDVPLVAGFKRAEEFGSVLTPYAIAVDERGIIRAKGLVNHLEHLESLTNALELEDSAFLEWRETAAQAAGSTANEVDGLAPGRNWHAE